ncbi:hypothetical protein GECvBGOT_gp168 [Salmonella phage GEC_vB_GOT]|nr:hypothetical protein GECvBGOT_gp168 [Salmonella phage GEC_vB_GOT]
MLLIWDSRLSISASYAVVVTYPLNRLSANNASKNAVIVQ